MILGIGIDIVDIRRIAKTLASLKKRAFTDAEQKTAEGRKKAGAKIIAATYAKRFAAKEACAKALGTGFNHGVFLRDVGVVNDKNGKPSIQLSGGALKRLRAMTPRGMKAVIHVTLTDDYPWAQAQVIISTEAL